MPGGEPGVQSGSTNSPVCADTNVTKYNIENNKNINANDKRELIFITSPQAIVLIFYFLKL